MGDKIIVIDGDNPVRRMAIIAAFKPYGQVYRYNCIQEKIEAELPDEPGAWDTIKEENMHFLIGLIHGGDKGYVKGLDIAVKVFYGGIEGYDTRVPKDEYQINRSILKPSDAPNEEEVKALLAMAKNSMPPPSLLFSPSYNPDTDHLIDIFHDELMAPQFIENWTELKVKHQGKFQNFAPAWDNFIKEVILLEEQTGPLNQQNNSYNQLVDELLEKIFQ